MARYYLGPGYFQPEAPQTLRFHLEMDWITHMTNFRYVGEKDLPGVNAAHEMAIYDVAERVYQRFMGMGISPIGGRGIDARRIAAHLREELRLHPALHAFEFEISASDVNLDPCRCS